MPVRVRQAVGLVRVEPMVTAIPVLPDNVLLVTEPARLVNCSISRPEAAFDAKFWQLEIVLPETFNVKESIPLGA